MYTMRFGHTQPLFLTPPPPGCLFKSYSQLVISLKPESISAAHQCTAVRHSPPTSQHPQPQRKRTLPSSGATSCQMLLSEGGALSTPSLYQPASSCVDPGEASSTCLSFLKLSLFKGKGHKCCKYLIAIEA